MKTQLKELLRAERLERYNAMVEKSKDSTKIKELVAFHGRKLKDTKSTEKNRELFLNWYRKKAVKELITLEKQYDDVMTAPDFDGLTVTVEWKKSRMWGQNPRSSTNKGFIGSSIVGCGFDKGCTATAEALNSHKPLLRLLYSKKERILSEHYGEKHEKGTKQWDYDLSGKVMDEHDLTRKYLGYGSGYSVLPEFEGGVGVSCHRSICEGLGLKWECVAEGKTFDVYRISKEVQK